MPEKTLSLSPQLAATLGLEEALLYQLLGEIQYFSPRDGQNLSVDCGHLLSLTPFWNLNDMRRILANLRDQGVIRFVSPPFGTGDNFVFSFHTGGTPGQEPSPAGAKKPSRLMDTSWRPARDVVAQLNQYGIPEGFIEEQIPEFVTYWAERGDPQHSWNAKFLKHTLRLWREEQTRAAKRSRESLMTPDWQPSRDAVELLTRQGGINRNFIEDAIPEFVLYWQERGERRSTWNTDFVRHVRQQWARYTATLEHDTEPRVISRQWKPSADLFEVLQLANIPRDFAEQQVAEFILYWRENGQALSSWNTKFLQHVKRQWARHCASGGSDYERNQGSARETRLRERSLEEALTDRSWAD